MKLVLRHSWDSCGTGAADDRSRALPECQQQPEVEHSQKNKTKLDVELKLRLGLAAIPHFCRDNYWKSVKFEADESCLVCAI